MKLFCWNVAGIRARLKKGALDFLEGEDYDVVCFQETKAEEHEVVVPDQLAKMYPYRYWQSTQGITQRKGFSGTAIWSRTKPLRKIPIPEFDLEGRITAVEFPTWNLVTVYTPNSQHKGSERNQFRTEEWDKNIKEFVDLLNKKKSTIICGDFNVGREDIDVYKPDEWRNRCAGFLDNERENFERLLGKTWLDSYRMFHDGEENKFTYWDQTLPYLRRTNRGWRIDYFLIPKSLKKRIINAKIHPEIMGSDHCPITLEFKPRNKKLKIVERLC
jgi:exodeoxyribonuclease III